MTILVSPMLILIRSYTEGIGGVGAIILGPLPSDFLQTNRFLGEEKDKD